MLAFDYCNPVKIIFENGARRRIAKHLNGIYRKVLLVSAKGPFRENGLYAEVKAQLEKTGAVIYEMNDIDSNPKMFSVYEGVEIARRNKIDCLAALGGGSAMDCTKLMALSARDRH